MRITNHSTTGYRNGCRCDICKAAKHYYDTQKRPKSPTLLDKYRIAEQCQQADEERNASRINSSFS